MTKSASELPQVKHDVFGTRNRFIRFVDKNGKKRKVKEKNFVEGEIEDRHLIKIAPLYWFSLDSHKILMIPLSIKYSAQEFMEQTKNQAVNFKDLMDQVNEIASEELKENE